MQSVILTLTVALAILLVFTFLSQRESRVFFHSQLTLAQSEKAGLQAEIQRLTNILASKDPMTFHTLQQALVPETLVSEVYQGTGSDEDEFKKWAAVAGVNEEDYTDDLIEMGFINDGA